MEVGDRRRIAAAERGERGGVGAPRNVVVVIAVGSEHGPFLRSATLRTAGGLLGEARVALAHKTVDVVPVCGCYVLSHRVPPCRRPPRPPAASWRGRGRCDRAPWPRRRRGAA